MKVFGGGKVGDLKIFCHACAMHCAIKFFSAKNSNSRKKVTHSTDKKLIFGSHYIFKKIANAIGTSD